MRSFSLSAGTFSETVKALPPPTNIIITVAHTAVSLAVVMTFAGHTAKSPAVVTLLAVHVTMAPALVMVLRRTFYWISC